MLEEEIVALKTEKKPPPTPYSEVNSTNIRKKMLQHEEIQGKAHCKDHAEDSSTQGTIKASTLTQVWIFLSYIYRNYN